MLAFKSGDLVVLKSGGPVMTIDTVNTSIFDDDEITGVLCVWFIGDKLERVRFDHKAIERFVPQTIPPQIIADENAPDDYSATMDSMVSAMNTPTDVPVRTKPAARRKKTAIPTLHANGTLG
jgi:uncharacterized protein YodC (DUF2158 family)